MLKIAKLLVSGGTAISLLALSTLPSFAATATVSGNGADSKNSINISSSNSVRINQTNTANISNNVSVVANTGGNTANENTGGNVSISTGNSNVSVGISNIANKNTLDLSGLCGCLTGTGFDVSISGNGADSHNQIKVGSHNSLHVNQKNNAHVNNTVWVFSGTGHNVANKNTGGNVSISTGNANSSVSIMNEVNSNSLSF